MMRKVEVGEMVMRADKNRDLVGLVTEISGETAKVFWDMGDSADPVLGVVALDKIVVIEY